MMKVHIAVQQEDFDFSDEYQKLIEGDTSAGAVVTFVGRVRANHLVNAESNLSQAVKYLELEHYPAMTEKALHEIFEQAKQRWDILRCTIIHRVGRLALGDQIVFVGVTSQHREDAFHAAEFMMDFLKTQAPFWKKESTLEEEHWVDAQEKDQEALTRW